MVCKSSFWQSVRVTIEYPFKLVTQINIKVLQVLEFIAVDGTDRFSANDLVWMIEVFDNNCPLTLVLFRHVVQCVES